MKNYVLLISALFALTASAQELPENLTYGGFIYNTTFGDKNWQKDRTVAAVNVDYFVDRLAFRTQLSTYENQPVRRAVVEYAHPIASSIEMIYQGGRFSRSDTFYEGITDNPGNYHQAVLPFAGYSYRMFNGAFVIMDGVNAKSVIKLDDAIISARVTYGTPTIPSQKDLQFEAFRREFKGYMINGTNDNYDISAHYETKNWHTYIHRSMYRFDDTTDGQPEGNYAYKLVSHIDYRLDKFGIKYDDSDYVAQIEWFHDITAMNNVKEVINGRNNAVGFNYLLGYYIDGNWFAYGGRSYGRNRIAFSHNEDNYLGVTYSNADWTFSFELHDGEGFAWRRYDAPYVKLPNVPSWNTWVTSVTYRF